MKIENKKITTYQICLVALAVGVNIVGGQIALFLKLPVYLDSIGTIFAGAVLGPWFGMIPNILSGIFMGMTVDIYSLYFAPVGIVTGFLSGLVFQKMSVKKGRIFLAAAVISVPGDHCERFDQCGFIWRGNLIRVIYSCTDAFQNTSGTDRKYFYSSVSHRLC
mgnify:CR=1 FL=1